MGKKYDMPLAGAVTLGSFAGGVFNDANANGLRDGNETMLGGAVLGWLFSPLMSANYEVLLRTNVPKEMLGRVYSARNTLQFFTIPIGYFLSGVLVDEVFEPLMEKVPQGSLLTVVFGEGKGSGAAFLYFVIGIAGVAVCLFFQRIKALRELD